MSSFAHQCYSWPDYCFQPVWRHESRQTRLSGWLCIRHEALHLPFLLEGDSVYQKEFCERAWQTLSLPLFCSSLLVMIRVHCSHPGAPQKVLGSNCQEHRVAKQLSGDPLGTITVLTGSCKCKQLIQSCDSQPCFTRRAGFTLLPSCISSCISYFLDDT